MPMDSREGDDDAVLSWGDRAVVFGAAGLIACSIIYVISIAFGAPSWAQSGGLGFELLKALPALFGSLAVAAIAGAIAWHQYLASKAKLNLDLFEKRLQLYNELHAYLASLTDGPSTARILIEELQKSEDRYYFYFGTELAVFVSLSIEKGIDQIRLLNAFDLDSERAFPAGEDWRHVLPSEDENRIRNELKDNFAWFEKQRIGLRSRFMKYLYFGNWS